MPALRRMAVDDSHIHIMKASDIDALPALLRACGVRRVNMAALPQYMQQNPGEHGDERPEPAFPAIGQNIYGLLAKLLFPGKVYCYGGLYHHLPPDAPDALDFAAQARRLLAAGCDGLKMIEGKPTTYRELGLPLTSPRYNEFYALLEANNVPLLFHVADPEEFWDAEQAPGWAKELGWLYDDSFPGKQQLYDEVDDVLERFPGLRVVFAHFYFLSADVERATRFLSCHPNVSLDITPGVEMFYNFAKDPDAWREFFRRFQDRLLFGSDSELSGDASGVVGVWPATLVKTIRRFLEFDGAFTGFDATLQGIGLERPVLEKIYRKNFVRMAGKKPAPVNLPLVRAECGLLLDAAGSFPVQVRQELELLKGRLHSVEYLVESNESKETIRSN